jgi:hypothetical protein
VGNPVTLLAAIMFVTILGMGIGNLLMTCAEIAGGLRQPLPERIQLSWIVLLPRAMLNLLRRPKGGSRSAGLSLRFSPGPSTSSGV